tara:strand:+ start:618 stop:881 length:264 start_codon:yes stop_codon:yes gene_type:complete
MEHAAILNLYPQVKSCWNEGEVWKFYDANSNEIEVSVDWNAVNTKASELQAEENAKEQAKIDLKASAKAKLISGEALTEEEANTIVI